MTYQEFFKYIEKNDLYELMEQRVYEHVSQDLSCYSYLISTLTNANPVIIKALEPDDRAHDLYLREHWFESLYDMQDADLFIDWEVCYELFDLESWAIESKEFKEFCDD